MFQVETRRGPLWLLDALLDTIYPEACVLCGTHPHQSPWCPDGPRLGMLRAWDRPHLCLGCLSVLVEPRPLRQERNLSDGTVLPFLGAGPTTADLARVIGAWKYHGLRGLSWPLAEAVVRALTHWWQGRGTGATLVPVPLHRRRQSQRGFNQAELLARLVASRLNLQVDTDLVWRFRHTTQQAKLTTSEKRYRNLAGSFTAIPPVEGRSRGLILVDDLVTSGATTGALAQALIRVGWRIDLVLAVGLGRDPD